MVDNKMEEKVNLDLDMEIPLQEVPKEEVPTKDTKKTQKRAEIPEDALVNCLRNERIIVRHVPKLTGMWGNNPKHILAGGMAEGAVRTFVVPRLSSGMFVNVLTDKEKLFLEEVMGTKQDNYFNLADPEDYIRYKILLANKDYIAPSLQALQDAPKATYQFVIISEGEETKVAKSNMSTTMLCYKEFGKVEDDIDVLRVIVETIDGRPTSQTAKLEFLQTKVNSLIQADSKIFLKVITDPMLSTKVLIKKAIEAGLISNRGNYLYLRKDNTPLCEANEEPTLNTAAKYLNSPKHQEVKFALEAKLK